MPEPKLVEAAAREPEMVRRVAEAMFEGYRRLINDTVGPDTAPIPWSELDGFSARCYCAAARAGIEAMRRPTTEAQIAWAAIRVPSTEGDWNETLEETAAIQVWEAGIDAALAAPDEGGQE